MPDANTNHPPIYNLNCNKMIKLFEIFQELQSSYNALNAVKKSFAIHQNQLKEIHNKQQNLNVMANSTMMNNTFLEVIIPNQMAYVGDLYDSAMKTYHEIKIKYEAVWSLLAIDYRQHHIKGIKLPKMSCNGMFIQLFKFKLISLL